MAEATEVTDRWQSERFPLRFVPKESGSPLRIARVFYKLNAYDMGFTSMRFHCPCDSDVSQKQFLLRTAKFVGMKSVSFIKITNPLLITLVLAHRL
jgi:hypothetical protein